MNKASLEGLKEVSRWVVLFIVSWIISQTLAQMDVVPEVFDLKVFVFTYAVPVRSTLAFLLTLAGRYVDKYIHEAEDIRANGLLPF